MSGNVISEKISPATHHDRSRNAAASSRSSTAQKFHTALLTASQQHSQTAPAALDPSARNSSYTVQPGDTLSEIVADQAALMGLKPSRQTLYALVDQVAAHNRLEDRNRIFPGQKLDLGCLASNQATLAAKTSPEPMMTAELTPLLPRETGFQPPVTGKITSLFGMRNHPVLGKTLHHDGIDISQPTGTPVKPLTDGVVTFSGDDGGYGQMIEIDHGNGLTSRYAHLSMRAVHEGEFVNAGQTLGRVGETGLATGPHLHLEVHRHHTPVDPLTVLNRKLVEPEVIVARVQTSHRF